MSVIQDFLKLGLIGCSTVGAYVGFCTIMTYFENRKIRRDLEDKQAAIRRERAAIAFRQSNCEHDWSTCLRDDGFVSAMDDLYDTIRGSTEGTFYYRCERCGLQENHERVRIEIATIGYGDRSVVGKLSLQDFASRLLGK